jgi:hypothetical protein
MTKQQAIDYFGGRRELAAALKIWPHNISRWGDRPPIKRQYQLEVMTNGRLKADRSEFGSVK